jgi:hypothetical protein
MRGGPKAQGWTGSSAAVGEGEEGRPPEGAGGQTDDQQDDWENEGGALARESKHAPARGADDSQGGVDKAANDGAP